MPIRRYVRSIMPFCPKSAGRDATSRPVTCGAARMAQRLSDTAPDLARHVTPAPRLMDPGCARTPFPDRIRCSTPSLPAAPPPAASRFAGLPVSPPALRSGAASRRPSQSLVASGSAFCTRLQQPGPSFQSRTVSAAASGVWFCGPNPTPPSALLPTPAASVPIPGRIASRRAKHPALCPAFSQALRSCAASRRDDAPYPGLCLARGRAGYPMPHSVSHRARRSRAVASLVPRLNAKACDRATQYARLIGAADAAQGTAQEARGDRARRNSPPASRRI